jgi:hypothetical protein
MSRYVTVYTEVEVDVDLSDLNITSLIEEVQDRGYDVFDKTEAAATEQAVWDLWKSYQHDKDEFFEKNLKKFFSEQLNINVQ